MKIYITKVTIPLQWDPTFYSYIQSGKLLRFTIIKIYCQRSDSKRLLKSARKKNTKKQKRWFSVSLDDAKKGVHLICILYFKCDWNE